MNKMEIPGIGYSYRSLTSMSISIIGPVVILNWKKKQNIIAIHKTILNGTPEVRLLFFGCFSNFIKR